MIHALESHGDELDAAARMRVNSSDVAVPFGFENMLRLREEGVLYPEDWQNVVQNSIFYLGSDRIRGFLGMRPGPLSAKLLREIEEHLHLIPPADSGFENPF